MPTCICGRPAIAGKHGPRLCAACDADYDTIVASVLAADDFCLTGTHAAVAREFVTVSAPAVPQ